MCLAVFYVLKSFPFASPTQKELIMEQQHAVSTTQTQFSRGFAPTIDFASRVQAAKKSDNFNSWVTLFTRAWNKIFSVPAQQLYELVKACPESFSDNQRDLRMELLEQYREELLANLTEKNINGKIRKFTTLLQLANFIGRTAYLRERVLTRAAFGAAKMPILPKEIQERISACEKWNVTNGGQYTEAELLAAGFELKKNDPHQKVFFHSLSRESLTVHIKNVSSEEDRAKARALRESARHGRREARSRNPNKGTSVLKKQQGKEK